MKIIALIPFFNEERTILEVVQEVLREVDLLLLVNDCSLDASEEKLRSGVNDTDRARIRYLSRGARGGKARAMKDAFMYIIEGIRTGEIRDDDIVVTIDGDGQLDPRDIPGLCGALEAERLDMLVATRDFSLYPAFKRMGNAFLSRIAAFLTGVPYKDTQCGLRAMTAGLIEAVLPYFRPLRYTGEQQLSVLAPARGLAARNDFPTRPLHYRSNSSLVDAALITAEGCAAYFRARAGRPLPVSHERGPHFAPFER